MNYSDTCRYCTHSEDLYELMIPICDMDASTLYLFREQTYRGRCLLAYKEHVKEICDPESDDYVNYMLDLKRASAAIRKAMNPDKINLGAFGDKQPHLHFHIVPKYDGGPDWGKTFSMNPKQTYLSEEEYAEIVRRIREALD